MEYGSGVGIAQRLNIEKQLLREEKYIVQALKTVKEERYGLQREGTDMLCLLREVLRQGKPSSDQGQEVPQEAAEQAAAVQSSMQAEPQPAPPTSASSLPDDFDLVDLNYLVGNEVELNLTVPSHPFYGRNIPEGDLEEMETEDEEDYEIEMSMLMNGQTK